jgi:hypothetical protein
MIFLMTKTFIAVSNKKITNKIIIFFIPKIFKMPVITAENPILRKNNLCVKISMKIRISPIMTQINHVGIFYVILQSY